MAQLAMLDASHYNEKLIFYVDIMGIGAFVTERTAPERHIEVYNLYAMLGRSIMHLHQDIEVFPGVNLSAQNYLRGALKRSLLSDTIILTLEADKIAYAPYLLRELALLQYHFLARGLLTRGIIMKGLCFHDDQRGIIYGDGLVRAYQQEKAIKFPKIVIEKELFTELGMPFVTDQRIFDLASATAEALTGQKTEDAVSSSLAFWMNAKSYVAADMFINDGTHFALTGFDPLLTQRYHQAMGGSMADIGRVITTNIEAQTALHDTAPDPAVKTIHAKQAHYWDYARQLYNAAITKDRANFATAGA